MPMVTFLIYTTLGSAIWNTVLIGAGWLLGANWGLVEKYQSVFGMIVVGAIVLAIAWFVGRRLLAGGKDRRGSPAAASD
jgi:membrane protein DedA with SNARE-associated domain